MEFLHGPALSTAIRNVIGNKSADMAVAFWGRGSCQLLGLPEDARGARVACDARSGACNPSALRDLLNRHVSIVDVPGLHAKVYVGAGGAIITSANASANGLAEESDGVSIGLEAGYKTTAEVDIIAIRDWFEIVFETGAPLTKDNLPEIEKLWEMRRAALPARRTPFGGNWKTRLDIVNCVTLPADIIDGGAYICPAQGGAYSHKPSRFFGMYRNKKVELVAEINAIVEINVSEDSDKIIWRNPFVYKTNLFYIDQARRIKFDFRPYESPVRVFILGKKFPTSFAKDSPGGMRQSKRYFDVNSLQAIDAEDLAAKLYGMAWSDLE